MNAAAAPHARPRLRFGPPLARAGLSDPVADPGALALSQLARGIIARVPHVLRDVRRASHSLVRRTDEQACREDRAWCFSFATVRAWCIAGEDAERELLRLIVGGAPKGRLSEIERRITAEAIDRLLQPSAHGGIIKEELRDRPALPAWSCSVDISSTQAPGALLELFTPCAPAPRSNTARPIVTPIALPVRATLATVPHDLASIARWRRGSIVRLQRGLEFYAIVFAGGRRIGKGQLGSLHGERAIMLTELWPRG